MLQIHSDGGFDGARAAAGIVLVSFDYIDCKLVPTAEGYKGVYIEHARSAFQAELLAADIAVSTALDIGKLIPIVHDQPKRVRLF